MNSLRLDPVNGNLLYATNSDGNSLLKVDLTTRQVVANMVLNNESNSPSYMVRVPGASRAYVLLKNTPEVLDVDLDHAQVVRTVRLPVTRTGFGAAFRDADTLLVGQGESITELAGNLTVRAQHDLANGTPAIWGMVASRDGKTVYSVSQPRGTESTFQPNTLIAIDTTSYRVKGTLTLDGGSFDLPWEHPDGRLYVLGGESNSSVSLHVVDAATLSLRSTIHFNDANMPGISGGVNYPYAYDAASHTLFVGTTWAVLAIDTDRDQIKKVIPISDITTAMGISRYDLTILNAVGLYYRAAENGLYIFHLDGSLMSVYDLNTNRFRLPIVYLKGYMPKWIAASDDGAQIWVANMRSDTLTVIDTASKAVRKTIDTHACNPYPASLQFGSGGPASQNVTFSRLQGSAACVFTTPGKWLSVSPTPIEKEPTYAVSADSSVFGPGTYQGAVTLRGTDGSEGTVDVSLKVGDGASSVRLTSVADGAGFGTAIAPGSWASAIGGNLAPATRTWAADEIVDGTLPVALEGVGVTVNGRSAAAYAVSPTQVNFQVPGGLADGTATVQAVNNGALSNTVSVSVKQAVPELFRFLPASYAVAQHTDYRIAAKPDLFPGCSDRTLCPASEASPGETILLYATGLGATDPAAASGAVIGMPLPLAGPVQVRFGSTTVNASAWLVSAGLYQINVKIPDAQPDGDTALTLVAGGATSTAKAQLSVKHSN